MFEMLNNLSVIALEVICNRIYFSALYKDRKSITQRQSYVLVLIQVIAFLEWVIYLRTMLYCVKFLYY